MARSLLSSRIVRIVLLAAASSMSACIIPVAPDFQDPPSRPDSPPGLFNFNPGFGSTTSILGDHGDFSAQATDADPGTTLYILWAVDYPPYTANTYPFPIVEKPAPADGEPPLQLGQTIICNYIHDRSTSTHSLELMVADAPFTANPDPTEANALEQLTGPGSIAFGRWTLNITCAQFMP